MVRRRTCEPSSNRRIEKNPFDKMSFSQLFASEEWSHHLDDIRPFAITSEAAVIRDTKYHCATLPSFTQDGDVDEEVMMSRFRDYLQQPENDYRVPIPAVVLCEFLESFGPLDVAFWKAMPVNTLIRASDGEIPISQGLSEHISSAFGTRTKFWVEMQAEYDEWCSVNRTVR